MSNSTINVGSITIGAKSSFKILNQDFKRIDKIFNQDEFKFEIMFGTGTNFYTSWFDKVPEVKRATERIDDGKYRPRYLGMNLPGIPELNVGDCAQGDKWGSLELAHAHETSVVCIRDGCYVRYEGKTDLVVYHEYAHVLSGAGHGHDSLWAQFAKRFNANWLKCPYVYVY